MPTNSQQYLQGINTFLSTKSDSHLNKMTWAACFMVVWFFTLSQVHGTLSVSL